MPVVQIGVATGSELVSWGGMECYQHCKSLSTPVILPSQHTGHLTGSMEDGSGSFGDEGRQPSWPGYP